MTTSPMEEGSPAPLFVIGSPRSGTTLMRRILNSHPAIHIAAETQFLLYGSYELADVHAPLSEPEVRAFFEWIRPFLEAERWSRIPGFDDYAAGLPATLPGLYRFVCLFESDRVPADLRYWGDNTPRYVCLVDVLRRFYANSRFVNVVRDARDVVASVKPLHIGGNTALVAAIEWADRVGRGVLAERAAPTAVLSVRYEDLLLDTAGMLQAVADFLGIDNLFDVDRVDTHTIRTASSFDHHQRLARPLDASSVGAYRARLAPVEIATVEAIAHDGLVAFGYDVEHYRPSPLFTSDYLGIGREYLASYLVRSRRRLRRRLGERRRGRTPLAHE